MNIKKLTLKTVIIFIIISLLYTCEDFINLNPLDDISSEDYWREPSHLDNYIKRFYNYFPSHANNFPLRESDDSDDMIYQSQSEILNGERTPTLGGWRSDWNRIRDINIFFDNYHKVETSIETYKHSLGEAYFFRAWHYFSLVDKYGDVPWYSTALNIDDDDELLRPRDSRTLVVDSILHDLDQAILHLDYRSERGNNTITKEVALAFKTRVALFEGTWQKYHKIINSPFATDDANPDKYFQECVNAAEELINNNNYNVGIYSTGDTNNDFSKLFGFTDMSNIDEILFYRAYNGNEDIYNDFQSKITYKPDGMGATWELVSSFLAKDGKPYDYLGVAETTKGNDFLIKIASDCDPRLRSTIFIPGDYKSNILGLVFDHPAIDEGTNFIVPTGFAPKKGVNPDDPGAGLTQEAHKGETGMIFFRYGEVLLNYAEAKYELNGTIAYEHINILRERVGMPAFEVNPINTYFIKDNYGYPISDELYAIRQERRVELALEGLRDEDYRRWAAHTLFKGKRPKGYPFSQEEFPNYNPPLDENGLIDYYKNAVPQGYQFRENQDYLNSIPQDELALNPNLTQNPGWGD